MSPRVVVGIPAYNEERNIRYILRDILRQELPEGFSIAKVLVVADGCTDRTVEVVRELARRYPVIKLISETKRLGQTWAINQIIKNADGDVLVILCADTRLSSKTTIKALLMPLEEDKSVGAVVGRAIPINDRRTTWGFIAHIHYSLLYEPEHLAVDFGSMTAMRSELLRPIPRWVMVPELYIDFVIKSKGYKVIHEPKAVVYMKQPDNIWDYIEQKRRDTFHILYLRRRGIIVKRRTPARLIRAFIKGLAIGVRKLHRILLMASIWAICYALALTDMLFKRYERYSLWRPISSTKVEIL